MGSVRRHPSVQAKVYLVFECSYEPGAGQAKLNFLVSRAGMEDVTGKTWLCQGTVPTQAQVADMAGYVADWVANATVTFCGGRQALELQG